MKNRRVVNRRLFVEELEGRLAPSVSGLAHSTLSYSTNWSGYAVTAPAGTVTSVLGSWTVPTVVGSGTAYAAQWVGIDGFSSSTVEQLGTEADVINGVSQYYAWYEMYPRGFVTIPMLVHPGDAISAGVSYDSTASNFTLTITNVTTAQPYSTTQALAGAKLSSAEWVVEAPSAGTVLPLANFGTTTFTGAKTTISGTTGPIDNAAWASGVNQINMISGRHGAVLDTTSALTDSGTPTASNFSVTFNQQVSTPPGHHQKGGPSGKSPDQVVALFSDTSPTGNSAASLFAASQPGGSSLLFAAPARPATPGADVGFGVRRFEFYAVGETLDDSGADDAKAPVVAPAPLVQQVHNAPLPFVDSHIAGADQAHWLAAIDAVFAQDFLPPEEPLPAQAERVDFQDAQTTEETQQSRENDRSLAGGMLVLAGAGLLLGVRNRSSKYPWAIDEDGRHYRVIL